MNDEIKGLIIGAFLAGVLVGIALIMVILMFIRNVTEVHAAELPAPAEYIEITDGPESAVEVIEDDFIPSDMVPLSADVQRYLFSKCRAATDDPEFYAFMLGLIDKESEFKSTAYHENRNGTADRGLCQTNSCHLGDLKRAGIIGTKSDLYDPYISIDAAMWELGKKLGEYGVSERLYYWYNTGKQSGSSNKNSRAMIQLWDKWRTVLKASEARDRAIETAGRK